MRWILGTLAVSLCLGCGGGGGGTPSGDGAIPLAGDTLTTNPPQIIYSVTGSYDLPGESGAISGNVTRTPLPAQVLGTTACDWNSQIFESLVIGGSVSNSTYRFYGNREDASATIFAEGGRHPDGVETIWSTRFRGAPSILSLGDSYDLLSDAPGVRYGLLLGGGVRVTLSAYSWTVTRTASVQVPLGWYECYVIAGHSEQYDGGTNLTTVDDEIAYVRPEIGVIYFVKDRVVSDGAQVASAHYVGEATDLIP